MQRQITVLAAMNKRWSSAQPALKGTVAPPHQRQNNNADEKGERLEELKDKDCEIPASPHDTAKQALSHMSRGYIY